MYFGIVTTVQVRRSRVRLYVEERSSSLLQNVQTIRESHPTSYSICKAKAIPVQTWRGPEGSRSLKLPDFKRICP